MTTPVIVLPGVMGSRLDLMRLQWDPDAELEMKEWLTADITMKQRHLSAAGMTARVLEDLHHEARPDIAEDESLGVAAELNGVADPEALAESRGWAGLTWGFYGPALLSLERELNPDLATADPSEEFPVFAFGYDWRESNLTSADHLAEFVDATIAATSASKVILVTHSMGGLVARAAVASHQGFADKVEQTIHVGQPADGTPACYRRFLTGVVPRYDVHAPLTEPTTWLQEHVLAHILGTTPLEFATLMSVLPGPMELLPNTRFGQQLNEPWLADSSSANLGGGSVYETYRRTDGVGIMHFVEGTETQAALDEQLKAAEQFHTLVGGVCHPSTICVYGTGSLTDRFTRPGQEELVPASATGDGTVDEASANGETFESVSVEGTISIPDIEHSTMLMDDAVITAIGSAVTAFDR